VHEKPYQSVGVRRALLGIEPVYQYDDLYGELICDKRGRPVAVRVTFRPDWYHRKPVIPGLDHSVEEAADGTVTVVYRKAKQT
jgi:hypothetical protein